MQLSLAGLWQVSPLTDLSIPQDDITFPAPLSQVLPAELTEAAIRQQE
ncbi:beta-galactosidase, partial [Vibrio parahaemolyticus]